MVPNGSFRIAPPPAGKGSVAKPASEDTHNGKAARKFLNAELFVMVESVMESHEDCPGLSQCALQTARTPFASAQTAHAEHQVTLATRKHSTLAMQKRS
jgi:hypothetical protein